MKKKTKPHQGIVLLKRPIKRTLGAWVEMEFDAKLIRLGLTWYRVKDGMGGKGDREDWVADVPDVCISVHDYHWNGDDFGPSYGTFNNAVKAETRMGLEHAISNLSKLEVRLNKMKQSISLLKTALKP